VAVQWRHRKARDRPEKIRVPVWEHGMTSTFTTSAVPHAGASLLALPGRRAAVRTILKPIKNTASREEFHRQETQVLRHLGAASKYDVLPCPVKN
jgi:hypothetical protein